MRCQTRIYVPLQPRANQYKQQTKDREMGMANAWSRILVHIFSCSSHTPLCKIWWVYWLYSSYHIYGVLPGKCNSWTRYYCAVKYQFRMPIYVSIHVLNETANDFHCIYLYGTWHNWYNFVSIHWSQLVSVSQKGLKCWIKYAFEFCFDSQHWLQHVP